MFRVVFVAILVDQESHGTLLKGEGGGGRVPGGMMVMVMVVKLRSGLGVTMMVGAGGEVWRGGWHG